MRIRAYRAAFWVLMAIVAAFAGYRMTHNPAIVIAKEMPHHAKAAHVARHATPAKPDPVTIHVDETLSYQAYAAHVCRKAHFAFVGNAYVYVHKSGLVQITCGREIDPGESIELYLVAVDPVRLKAGK